MERLVIVGWILTALGAIVLFLGGVLDIMRFPSMVKNLEAIDFPPDTIRPFGAIKVTIAILSLIPATSFVGVILATGWMGGAIAAHVRVKQSYLSLAVIPVVFWVGLGLRYQSAMHILLHL